MHQNIIIHWAKIPWGVLASVTSVYLFNYLTPKFIIRLELNKKFITIGLGMVTFYQTLKHIKN